jgi:hypothetical protein
MAEAEREEYDAAAFFERMLHLHVEQPLNVQDLTIAKFSTMPGSEKAAAVLATPEVWRPFMPPLYNFIFTCIEVFLERHFIESYRGSAGRVYASTEEWTADFSNFKASITWPNKEAKKCITRPFSFQRLPAVDVLYAVALKGPLSAYPKFELVKLMFGKRHLFTHRGGIIDNKFLQKYNDFHAQAPQEMLPPSSVGKSAFLERSWVRDTLSEARAFVSFVGAAC